MSSEATFSQRIVAWQQAHGRHDLPWQGSDPYHVWLSEIMLQQTQVVKVIEYFDRFITALPDLPALAAADEQAVLALCGLVWVITTGPGTCTAPPNGVWNGIKADCHKTWMI